MYKLYCLPDIPTESLSGLQACPFYMPVISYFSWQSIEEMVFISPFFSCLLFLHPIRAGCKASRIWGLITGFTWTLESSVSCYHMQTTFRFTWLRIIIYVQNYQQIPVAKYPNKCGKMFKKTVFTEKISVENFEKIWKNEKICPDLLQQAATSVALVWTMQWCDEFSLVALSVLILSFHILNLFAWPLPSPLTAAGGNPTYAFQLGMMLLRHPPCQVALAAWVAVLAGFTAWYLLWPLTNFCCLQSSLSKEWTALLHPAKFHPPQSDSFYPKVGKKWGSETEPSPVTHSFADIWKHC